MEPEIPLDDEDRILDWIRDDSSPVGIDAKRTHVIIIHKLMSIERRLDLLERKQQSR